jgi:hypothetical protein
LSTLHLQAAAAANTALSAAILKHEGSPFTRQLLSMSSHFVPSKYFHSTFPHQIPVLHHGSPLQTPSSSLCEPYRAMAKTPPTDWDVLSDGTNTPSTDVPTRRASQHITYDNSDPTIMQAATPADDADEATSYMTSHNVSSIALGPFTVVAPVGASIVSSSGTTSVRYGGAHGTFTAGASAKALMGGSKVSARGAERESILQRRWIRQSKL